MIWLKFVTKDNLEKIKEKQNRWKSKGREPCCVKKNKWKEACVLCLREEREKGEKKKKIH